jgi:hypothetical protein
MNFDLWLVRVAVESRNFGVVEAIAKAQSPKPQQLISDRRPIIDPPTEVHANLSWRLPDSPDQRQSRAT